VSDQHFRSIFSSGAPGGGRKLLVHPGVTKWVPPEDEPEYDVVKKRRLMDSAPLPSSTDNSPAALADFEDFERSVLPALKSIHAEDEHVRRQEIEELEENMAKGIIVPSTGGVYFAWSDCLGCMKIGATRRQDPSLRLQELSRHVTVPFRLVRWVPTPTPFRLEALVHEYFAEARIRNAGAGTEFFDIDEQFVVAYCDVL
jgi:hypothetical protein